MELPSQEEGGALVAGFPHTLAVWASWWPPRDGLSKQLRLFSYWPSGWQALARSFALENI